MKKSLYILGFFVILLMILGLVLNYLLPLFSVEKPLSTIPINIVFWACVLIFAIIYFKKRGFNFSRPNIPLKVYLLFLLPIMAVGGAELVNYIGYNYLLLVMIPCVILVGGICLMTKWIPENYHVFAIWAMVLSILLHRALITHNLSGTDNILELWCFRDTLEHGIWSSTTTIYKGVNSVLSITILPVMLSKILFINGIWVFKLIFPILLSFVPVAIYELVKLEFKNIKIAFLSAFLVMSVYTFYTVMLMTDKQLVATFLFSIFILMLFDGDYKYKNLMLIGLGFGVAVSHYATAPLLLIVYLVFAIFKKNKVMIFSSCGLACITVFWYSYFSNNFIFNQFGVWGNGALTSTMPSFTNEVSAIAISNDNSSVNMAPFGNILSKIFIHGTDYLPLSTVILYVVSQVMIVVGLVSIIYAKLKDKVSISKNYIIFALVLVFLLGLELWARFSNIIGIERIYLYCMMGLSPIVFWVITKYKYWVYASFIFVSLFFLFNIGYIHDIIGKPLSHSIAISGDKADYPVFSDNELVGAEWILNNTDGKIYTDNYSNYLFNYLYLSLDDTNRVKMLVYELNDNHPIVVNKVDKGSYVYLRNSNVLNEKLNMHYYVDIDSTTVSYSFDELGAFTNVIETAKTVYENSKCKVLETTIDY